MKIIGCDFHPSYQQIAVLDSVTGEMVEKALSHERKEEVRAFYAGLKGPVRVGIEASGQSQWFDRMSRSAFAFRFKELLGETPLEYLTNWRMVKATGLLQEGDTKLFEVAKSVGYDSDAAFSKAFKRVLGVAPRKYRRGEAEAL